MEKCLCCGFKTLGERGHFEICSVCFWEDDNLLSPESIDEPSGTNNDLTLRQGQANFLLFGACEERFVKNVRKPLKSEF